MKTAPAAGQRPEPSFFIGCAMGECEISSTPVKYAREWPWLQKGKSIAARVT